MDLFIGLISGIIGGSIVAFINHKNTLNRALISEKTKYLDKISDKVRLLNFLYRNYLILSQSYDFKNAILKKQEFEKVYLEAYDYIYIHYEEFEKIFSSNIEILRNNFDEISSHYQQIQEKEKFDIENNIIQSTLKTQDFYVHEIFNKIYICLKTKYNKPLETVNFERLDEDDVIRYDPYNYNKD